MSTKHTPGPWVATRIVDTIYVNGPYSRVATITPGKGDEEDAQLIAAAPDLLTACEAMAAAIAGGNDTRTAHVAATRLILAAIAKAKGE